MEQLRLCLGIIFTLKKNITVIMLSLWGLKLKTTSKEKPMNVAVLGSQNGRHRDFKRCGCENQTAGRSTVRYGPVSTLYSPLSKKRDRRGHKSRFVGVQTV